ncbi:unnamed protein product [Leuciscus chuanchicus]
MFSEGRDEDPDRTEATIEVGQWVLVEYDGDLFPVEDLERNDGTVDRPYFMPEILPILKKSNEGLKTVD